MKNRTLGCRFPARRTSGLSQGLPSLISIALWLVALALPHTAYASIGFATVRTFTAGATPQVVVTADFNGDGKLDVAVANSGSNNVSVLLGNGDGTFQAAVDYNVGATPMGLAVGDFNDDSRPDLVAANNAGANVSILINNGDGTFQSAVNYSAGVGPAGVAVGDFNNDGNQDVAVADSGSGSVDVLLGNGNGTFQAGVLYGVGTNPQSVAVGDFNGDGYPDLVSANKNSNNVSVLINNRNGTFKASVSYSTGTAPLFVATGDFNNDGKIDLAVTSGDGVDVLLGNGDGTFQVVRVAGGAVNPSYIAVGDLNGDGNLDLAVAGPPGNDSLEVFLGKGDGNFDSPSDYNVSGSTSVAVADFNGDGHLDAVVIDSADNITDELIGEGNGTFQSASQYNGDGAYVAVGDLNGDGYLDLVASGTLTSGISVLLGNGDGTFGTATNYSIPGNGGPGSVALGDFNGDGVLDIAVVASSNVGILLGNGDGTFNAVVTYPVPNYPQSLAVADLNGDGHLDVATANGQSNNVSVLLGNGNGTLQPASNYPVNQSPVGVAVGDFNGDGHLDLAVSDYNQSTTASYVDILLNNGNGTFGGAVSYATGGHYSYSVAVGDFTGSGTLDLAVTQCGSGSPGGCSSSSGSVGIVLGNSDGTFGSVVTYDAGAYASSVVIADFNGDSKQDLAVANDDGSLGVTILLGNGDGTFESASKYTANYDPLSLAVGDVNRDGASDLVVGNYNGFETVLLNTAGTSVSLASSQNPSPSGQPVTFTATVTASIGGSGSPTGNVTFLDGNTMLGTVALSSGVATFTSSGLSLGSHNITAMYAGDTNFVPHTGAPLTQVVSDEPLVMLSPSSLTFSAQILNTTSAAQVVTLSNTGSAALTISSIAISGTNAGDFSQTNTCGSSVAAGATCTISVTFTPTTPGARTGSITITDNANPPTQTVSLTGTGVAAPVVSFSPASLSFAAQEVGTSSPIAKVTLTNKGTAVLSITSSAASGDFSLPATLVGRCKGSIAAGASCTISVIFEPKSAGALAGSLTVADNAAGSPQTLALAGTGTAPAATLAPGSVAFAAELAGQSSSAHAVSLTNSGAAPLAISGISFSGADAGDFTQQNNCGSGVATDATCTINVSFKPTSGGARSATLNVTDNAPASPQSVALTGTASDFTLGVASGSSSSATVTAGESASYKLSAGSVGNLSGSVSLACSGAPTAATCSIAAPAVSVGPGLVSQPIVVTVSTTARSGVLPRWPKLPPPGSWPLSTWWLIGLVSLAALTMLVPVRRAVHHGVVHPRPALLPVLLVLLACLALSIPACGGGGRTTTTTTPAGTPAGTYTLTITGTYTSGSVTVKHSANLSLTVQ